jgi:hypothetical protein
MHALQRLKSLAAEKAEAAAKLAPIIAARDQRISEANAERKRREAAGAEQVEAIRVAGIVAGQHVAGTATVEQLRAAEKARAEAMKRCKAIRNDSDALLVLESEIHGLDAAAEPLQHRLAALTSSEAAARIEYLRAIGNAAAATYASLAGQLLHAFADVCAVNMALARIDGANPDLTTGSTENLLIPAFNAPSARSPSGTLGTTSEARKLYPGAFSSLKARIDADGVFLPGI